MLYQIPNLWQLKKVVAKYEEKILQLYFILNIHIFHDLIYFVICENHMLVILIEILQGKNVAIWSVFSLIFIKNIDYIWTKTFFKEERDYFSKRIPQSYLSVKMEYPVRFSKWKTRGGDYFSTSWVTERSQSQIRKQHNEIEFFRTMLCFYENFAN